MPTDDSDVSFERLTDLEAEGATLIEGLPGHGLVAAIAVDQITRQLDLEHHGNVVSEELPPVASFLDGRVRDTVRVYGGEDPAVMTLQSDIAVPPHAFQALSRCVLEDVAQEFDRAIFLAGAPARNEDGIGEVVGVATTDAIEADLRAVGIELADGVGMIGGVTGALANACYHAEVPAAVLIVGANPYIPDPRAAQRVIEDALEPLVHFDIDTSELQEQADEIQRRMQQIAEQYQQMTQEEEPNPARAAPSMYQ